MALKSEMRKIHVKGLQNVGELLMQFCVHRVVSARLKFEVVLPQFP